MRSRLCFLCSKRATCGGPFGEEVLCIFAMLRRLLACFALISGLAAIGSPVSPAMAEAVTGQVGQSVEAREAHGAEKCTCHKNTAAGPEAKKCADSHPAPRRTIRIYIPTVQFGADRAYE